MGEKVVSQSFNAAQQVLDGVRAGLTGTSSKLLQHILTSGGADVAFRKSIVVRYAGQHTRNLAVPEVAIPIVSILLDRLRISRTDIEHGVVVGLPAEQYPTCDGYPGWSHGRRVVWVTLSDDALLLSIRENTGQLKDLEARPIPTQGDLSIPTDAEGL